MEPTNSVSLVGWLRKKPSRHPSRGLTHLVTSLLSMPAATVLGPQKTVKSSRRSRLSLPSKCNRRTTRGKVRLKTFSTHHRVRSGRLRKTRTQSYSSWKMKPSMTHYCASQASLTAPINQIKRTSRNASLLCLERRTPKRS